MGLQEDVLESEPLGPVLAREHERAKADESRMAAVRPRIEAAKADGSFTYDLYPTDVYLAIEPAMGRFLFQAARAVGARTVIEFGTSFGISTLYLAAAARETGGRVIGTELEPAKATRARANLAEAGLERWAEIRVGDALETLKDIDGPVDVLFLDGWKDLYLPVLEFMRPALRSGARVLADNVDTFASELAPYWRHVTDPAGPFRSTKVPFRSGLAYSVYGAAGTEPLAEPGTLAGIARRSGRRAPMEQLDEVDVTAHGGLAGDSRGRFRDRAVTVLAKEGWTAALAELGLAADTDWTLRRANLLTEGVTLPRARGGVIGIGETVLEVTGECSPCARMDEALPGLLKALAPEWRGGVTCRVLKGGALRMGAPVQILVDPPARRRPVLPG